jgi:hypothetical protein
MEPRQRELGLMTDAIYHRLIRNARDALLGAQKLLEAARDDLLADIPESIVSHEGDSAPFMVQTALEATNNALATLRACLERKE